MPKPLLCVTVAAPTMAELRRRRDAVEEADLLELRLDSVSDPSVPGALEGRRRPVIVTCRPVWEGGAFSGPEEDRKRLLAEALAQGAEYVDIEWRAHFDDLIAPSGGRRIVLSSHDFHGVPVDLVARVHAMRSTGAEVVKVAAAMTSLSDCIALLDLAEDGDRSSGLVLIGMGEYGLATRVLAGRFGSMWTYAGDLHEVGQLTAATLIDHYRFRTIDETTAIYGLVGAPVAHSVSPAMHNAAFAAARLNAVYLPFPAIGANDFVRFATALGVKGASVTVPFKVALFEDVNEVDAVARRVGAINTIRVTDGRWIGGNTDVSAFLEALRNRVPLANTRTAVLGAGGAARAVAVALASSGGLVRIHARDRGRAEEVAALTSATAGPWPPEPGSWDLLVNCTPIGMHPRVDATPLPAAQLTGRYVYDLIYNPPVTRLLREAQTAGCHIIGGLEMLVAQAHEQFQWWMNTRPQAGVMRDAALKRLAEFTGDEHHVV
ncbi:MAG TPA: shikimate dehydrogenase [Vicinamibacterales bacterium]|nr:shikimate dehydrogenase [Vicinamibacterales bacterium]